MCSINKRNTLLSYNKEKETKGLKYTYQLTCLPTKTSIIQKPSACPFWVINTPVNVILPTQGEKGKEDSSSCKAGGKTMHNLEGLVLKRECQGLSPHSYSPINKSTYSAAHVLYPYLWLKHVQSHWHQCQM